jgi:hypothetical protein
MKRMFVLWADKDWYKTSEQEIGIYFRQKKSEIGFFAGPSKEYEDDVQIQVTIEKVHVEPKRKRVKI